MKSSGKSRAYHILDGKYSFKKGVIKRMSAWGVKAWKQDEAIEVMVTMTIRDVEAGQGRQGQANSSTLLFVHYVWLHLNVPENALERGL